MAEKTDTVNVDTLVERLRGLSAYIPVEDHYGMRPRDQFNAALSDLAARARLSDQRRKEVLDLKPAATALVKDRDRLARRVAELEQDVRTAMGAAERFREQGIKDAERVAELEAAPRADNIPRDTDEKPSDAMPAAGFADWRESSEWWQSTCEYWKARADAHAGDGGGA